MKQRIYPDTSVIGGVYDPEFADWSERLIQEFKDGHKIAVISDLTLKEIEDSPTDVRYILKGIPNRNKELVVLNDDAKSLAMTYMSEGAVTEKYLVDAQHIAMATIYRVDVLVSWNFKHIVNMKRIRLYNAVNLKHGYPLVEIRSPREVLYE